MRTRGALFLIAAMALAACGSGSATSAPASAPSEASAAPSMAASEAPSIAASDAPASAGEMPSMNPLDLGLAAGDVSQLDSYHMELTVATGSEQQKLTVEATKKPVAASHYILGGQQSMEFITIKGQGSWIKQGSTWAPVPAGADAMMSVFDALAPDTIISGFSLGQYGSNLELLDTKEKNGVQAAHYHLDATLASKLNATDFPADGSLDVWVATDGGYLVAMEFSGTQPSGEHADVSIDVTRVNDPTLVIKAPTSG